MFLFWCLPSFAFALGFFVSPGLKTVLWTLSLGFMGSSMFAECLPVRPHSLLLHRPVFHRRCCYFAGIWYWAATAWAVRVEMDW
jgi:hypothetical protein